MHKKTPPPATTANETPLADGYTYPAGEDIYIAGKKQEAIDPEKISAGEQISEIIKQGSKTDQDTTVVPLGDDLDVPGAELDDAQEKVGSEDEENNYYSIGGDDHTDLDEDFRE